MNSVIQPENVRTFSIGERVCVKTSVSVYHHPEHRGHPLEMKDRIGEVVAVLTSWKGTAVSANLPIQVKFGKKFKAHFLSDELERLN